MELLAILELENLILVRVINPLQVPTEGLLPLTMMSFSRTKEFNFLQLNYVKSVRILMIPTLQSDEPADLLKKT